MPTDDDDRDRDDDRRRRGRDDRDRDDDREYDDRDRDRDDGDDDRPRGGRAVRRAKERVRGAAIALLVTGIVSLLMAALGIVNVFTMDRQFDQVEQQWDNDPNLKPQQRQELKDMLKKWRPPIKVLTPISVGLGLLTALITIFGAVQMMNVKSRGLAMTGSVLSMIPCVGGCCFLGLPIGIWALIVLAKPEVKAGFAAAARTSRDEY